MAKIALITDTHYGVRQDNPAFYVHMKKFFDRVFFPELEKRRIGTVIHLGDLLDQRTIVNFATLERMYADFIEPLDKYETHIILGNHDVFYKNTNVLNSVELLLRDRRWQVYSRAQEVMIDGRRLAFVPWVNRENLDETMKFLSQTYAGYVLGHLEVNGSPMDSGQVCEHGLDKITFNRFNLVLSGHFHSPSVNGNIRYLGAAFPFNWADHGGTRGFHILDTETMELEFIANPYSLFHRYVYDDSTVELEEDRFNDTKKSFDHLTGTYVKVTLRSKHNPYIYDTLIEKIQDSRPLKLTVEDERPDVVEDQIETLEVGDAGSFLSDFIDHAKLGPKTKQVKNMMLDIHREALELDRV